MIQKYPEIYFLKYQKSLVLQPEHKAVSLTDQRLSWDRTKTKTLFPNMPSVKGIFFWQRWKIHNSSNTW